MFKNRYPILVVLGSALLILVSGVCAFADEIKIGAGAAPMSAILKPVQEHFEKASGHKLVLLEKGPKLALQELLSGSLNAAGAGLTMDEWIAMMKKEGVEVRKEDLKDFVVGKSRAVAMINKANPVSKLSKEQLIGIFTGKISNWKEVGGEDMPVMIVWGKLTPGMNSLFVNKVLDKSPVIKDVLDVGTGPDLRANVASNPEAIGVSASSVADDTVKVPEQPEAVSDIVLVTKGAPSAAVQQLLDFIKGVGQKYIKQ